MVYGKHYIVDFIDCDKNLLNSLKDIEEILIKTAKEINATIVSSNFNQFYPYGISGVLIVAESHITIHTWVKEKFVSIDMFVCDMSIDLDKGVNFLKKALKAKRVKLKKILRSDDCDN